MNTDNNSPFTGILVSPMIFENPGGEYICIPSGTQIIVTILNSYCDTSPKDIEEALDLFKD